MYDMAEHFSELLLEGNQKEAWRLIDEEVQSGKNSMFVFHTLLTSAMRHIGYLWEQNLISVADEHLASAVCDVLISKYQARHQQAFLQKKAMFLCVEGEQHYLGSKMVSSCFEENGWTVRYFGPDLPLDYALTSASSWKPDVVGLSVSLAYNLPQVTEYIRSFERLSNKPLVMLGGRITHIYDVSPYVSNQTLIIKDLFELQRWLSSHSNPILQKSSG